MLVQTFLSTASFSPVSWLFVTRSNRPLTPSHLVKSSSNMTPQPTAPSLSDVPHLQEMTGAPSRVASLRAECLERDRHRCVISRGFDITEAKARYQFQGRDKAKDDDGNLLKDERNPFTFLEVASILPHSLMSVTNAKSPLVCNLSGASHFSTSLADRRRWSPRKPLWQPSPCSTTAFYR
jgi:hypothetical protein